MEGIKNQENKDTPREFLEKLSKEVRKVEVVDETSSTPFEAWGKVQFSEWGNRVELHYFYEADPNKAVTEQPAHNFKYIRVADLHFDSKSNKQVWLNRPE
ncbi:hypothetical protein JDN40_04185 [Rhodomicrobium vannielii ATCC 17100]|uniref:hypothetical protein n=1 Tax=Rhodomicrobium vannielii TaxID=1069 RepID=UPI001919F16F|nr:hypothetical protein [Rhodomicrobium vannielii]MBJ7533306.1 hypothetical protein [Rhodomicrobium vannielii ATCC 17100]